VCDPTHDRPAQTAAGLLTHRLLLRNRHQKSRSRGNGIAVRHELCDSLPLPRQIGRFAMLLQQAEQTISRWVGSDRAHGMRQQDPSRHLPHVTYRPPDEADTTERLPQTFRAVRSRRTTGRRGIRVRSSRCRPPKSPTLRWSTLRCQSQLHGPDPKVGCVAVGSTGSSRLARAAVWPVPAPPRLGPSGRACLSDQTNP